MKQATIRIEKVDGIYIENELKKRCYSLSSVSKVIFPNRDSRTLKSVLKGRILITPSEMELLYKYVTSRMVAKEVYTKISELESIVRSLGEEDFALPLFE